MFSTMDSGKKQIKDHATSVTVTCCRWKIIFLGRV